MNLALGFVKAEDETTEEFDGDTDSVVEEEGATETPGEEILKTKVEFIC